MPQESEFFFTPNNRLDATTQADQERTPETRTETSANPSADKVTANHENTSNRKTQPNTSQAKIRANRKNAKKSTGPKTLRGKRNSSRNALKHGILVGEIVALQLSDKIDLEKLHQDLVEDYRPEGRVENLLVERIATCFWKLRLTLRAEQGTLGIESVELGERLVNAGYDTFKLNLAALVAMIEDENTGKNHQGTTFVGQAAERTKVILNLRRTLEGIVMFKGSLKALRDELQEKGSVSDEKKRLLRDTLDDDLELLLRDSRNLQDPERRKLLLAMVDQKLMDLNKQMELIAAGNSLKDKAELLRASIPTDASMDNILRYETHIERQLYRAMDQLERIQRRRRGESVPAPLRLDIGK